MNFDKQTLMATGGATLVCLATWILLPSLQSGEQKAESAASVHIERARRMMYEYNPALAYRSTLLQQLADTDVDVEKLDDLSEEAAEKYGERFAASWAAITPVDFNDQGARPARAPAANPGAQVREGVKTRAALTAANNQLLKDAQAEIDAALEAAGDSQVASAEATRLKAVILHHRGLAERVRAGLIRADADEHRRDLVRATNEAAQWTTGKSLVADSGVDGQIAGLKEEIGKVETTLAGEQKELAAIEAKVKEAESKIAAAKTQADRARAEMEQLQRSGVDFSDPKGSQNFAASIEKLDAEYRQAIRVVQTLEAGDLPKAQIDASGDFLRGRYLENGSPKDLTTAPGLARFRDEQTILAVVVEGRKQAVVDLKSDLKRLEGIKAAAELSQADAERRIGEALPLAGDAFDQLSKMESEAATIEDAALKLLDEAAKTAQTASTNMDAWVSAARERTQNLAAEVKDRSAFAERENDDWMAGHIAAQAADARLERAWIYYDRFASATENVRVLNDAKATLGLKEADPDAEQAKADDARTKGIDEVNKAMDVLQKAHGRTEKHWTLTAQGAGTTYLLALFGHADYTADVVEGYRAALKGRETDKTTEKLAARLKRLESR